jgi:hypothetical protein
VPVTVTDVRPAELTVKVAAPVPEELAATVTGCGYIQLLVVKVSEAPEVMVSPELPDAATVTAMLPVGAADRSTPNSSLVPCATENVDGSASSEPPPVPVEVLVGVGVGVGDDEGDEVGEDVGLTVGLTEGLGEEEAPLQATPLRVKAVGAVLVPL